MLGEEGLMSHDNPWLWVRHCHCRGAAGHLKGTTSYGALVTQWRALGVGESLVVCGREQGVKGHIGTTEVHQPKTSIIDF